MKLADRIAVVAGASRGAGRGIALALGEAGATVYVAGRTTRGGAPPADGAAGTIDDTADEVTARGGTGIPVRVDVTKEDEVAALFERIERAHGKVDVLANAVWGASDRATSLEDMQAMWGQKFWEGSPSAWHSMMTAGPYAYLVASTYAMRLMLKRKKGLIVGVTDNILAPEGAPVPEPKVMSEYGGQLIWDLAHLCIDRMMYGMSVEAKPHKVAVIALMPGFMRTERIVQYLQTEEQRKAMRFDRSETTEYLGRAVAALAADPKVLQKTGKIHIVADLAREYGFTDVDGRQVPRFNPFG
ncbi:MAG TPA: SDR family NAD(P)-dependent oxidoreductase [Longimicrobiales bacterium]|nr:SDR family NAD(P)-dependent oxidoreductase [Longimicrobiales bacterium]